jgi:transmembrane sensor
MQMDDTARKEATRWLILLQDQPNDRALKAAFEGWLAANPANVAAWAETSRIGDLIAQTPPKHRARWTRQKSPRRVRAAAATVAALAIAAAIALVLMPNLLLGLTADYATGTAELRNVSLPDGSVITLAPDSAIDVDYATGKRRVLLLAGGAFFEVESDAARPFTVSANAIETTVLGTAFEVRLNEHGASVAVRHGSVRVESATLHAQLEAGEWVRVGASGAGERGAGASDAAGAWMRGELIARDQTIGEVAEALRDYFHGAILVTDDELAAQRVTGIYDLDDPIQTLRAVAMTHHATLRQVSPWVLVLSKD